MKNLFKLSFIAFALTISLSSCGLFGSKHQGEPADTLKTDTNTIDTTKIDTSTIKTDTTIKN